MTHLSDDHFKDLLANREIDEAARAHLAGCERCTRTFAHLLEQAELDCEIDELLSLPQLAGQLDAVAARHAPEHLEDEQLSGLLAGTLDPDAKSRALKHLEHCTSCALTFDALYELHEDQTRTAALLEDPALEAQLDAVAHAHAPASAWPIGRDFSWLRAPVLAATLALSVGSIAAIDILHQEQLGWASERYEISRQNAERLREQRITELETQVARLLIDQPQLDAAAKQGAEQALGPLVQDAGEVERLAAEVAGLAAVRAEQMVAQRIEIALAEDRARRAEASQAERQEIEAEIERLKNHYAEERRATQGTIAVLEEQKKRLERSLSLLKAQPEVLEIFARLEIPSADQEKFWNLPAETITEFEHELRRDPKYFQSKTARVGVLQWIAEKSP